MPTRSEEIEAFKSQINLSEYAASQGYVLDRKERSRNSAVMRHPDGDKIVIARAADRHWIYFSVRDDQDNGSIIDFVLGRETENLGQVRQALRPWLSEDRHAFKVAQASFVSDLRPITRDLEAVLAKFAKTEPVNGRHSYLEGERCIPAAVLADRRFRDRVHCDARGNAIFPHFGPDGITGYEIKNNGFTNFSAGGWKSCWCSRAGEGTPVYVFAETGIDALSHAALKPEPRAQYFSIGGELSPTQPDLITSAFQKLPEGGQVILAVDHDEGGDKLVEKIKALFAASGHTGASLAIDRPPGRGEDWNDVLRASMAKVEPLTPET